jgi:hypothetical protein
VTRIFINQKLYEMKKYVIILSSIMLFSLPLFAITVPVAVSSAFAKKFPGAVQVKWGKESSNEYEAEFKWNGKTMSANFSKNGTWVETETEINVAECPAAVDAAIHNKYPGAVLLKAFRIEKASGSVLFEAELKTGNKKKEMVINENGSLVK